MYSMMGGLGKVPESCMSECLDLGAEDEKYPEDSTPSTSLPTDQYKHLIPAPAQAR